MNRFWVWIAGSFALGVLVAGYAAYPVGLAGLSLFFCAFLAAAFAPRLAYRQQMAVALAFSGLGMLYAELLKPAPGMDPLYVWCQRHHAEPEHPIDPHIPVTLEGVIKRADFVLPESEYATFILYADTLEARGETHRISSRVRVVWGEAAEPVYPGQRVRVQGILKNRLGTFNFGIGGIEPFYHRQGVFTSLNVPHWSRIEVLGENRWSPWFWIAKLRQREAEVLREAIPESTLNFVYTVWLGERRGYSSDEYEKYLQTGTAHILAVSGVHVGIIYISLSLLLGTGMRNRKWRAVIIIAAVWLFALLAGARVSSVRAAIMITIYLAAELFDREPDAQTSLSQAAFLFLILQPMLLFDLGFLLSFSSVASIMIFTPRVYTLIAGAPWWLKNNLSPVLAVQILPFPLISSYFQVVPLIGPLINLAILPLLSVVLWLALITTLFALTIPPVAPLFGYAIQPVVALIDFLALQTSRVPGAFFRITSPTPWAAAFYWIAALCFAHAATTQKKPKRYALFAVCLLVLCGLFWRPFQPPGVDFLDVGHGDAAFVRTPGGTTMLIDGGDRSDYVDYGGRVVVPFLYRHGVSRLDYIMMTHPDRDHVGGLIHTLQNIPVSMAILPPIPSDRELELDLLRLCKEHGVAVQRVQRGDIIKAKGAQIEVLSPDAKQPFGSVNENSLVVRVRWPGMDVLFTGDIQDEAERNLAEAGCSATILKVPHHGSHTSSSQLFLEAVNPSVAVVSTQGSTRRAPVHPDVQARYDDLDIPLFRTDRSGGVRIRQDNGTLLIHGARKAHGLDLSPVP